jgi:uncharacterized ubiquitin-like protein YukD
MRDNTKILIAMFLLVLFALCFVNYAMAWDLKITDKAGKKALVQTVAVADECVIIDINEQTKLKVCKCGQVLASEWKEVVKNKDQGSAVWSGETLQGITIRNGSGSNYILTN